MDRGTLPGLMSRGMRFTVGAGELDFRDFPGLLGEKENRIGIARTLPL
jgi:hypothetical protein